MKEIVINKCYGGFGLSHKATMRYAELKGIKLYIWADEVVKKVYGTDDIKELLKKGRLGLHYSTVPSEDKTSRNENFFSEYDIERTDPALIKVVKELGKEASGDCAELKIIKIPNGIEYEIGEYDGIEHIAEKHRTWN